MVTVDNLNSNTFRFLKLSSWFVYPFDLVSLKEHFFGVDLNLQCSSIFSNEVMCYYISVHVMRNLKIKVCFKHRDTFLWPVFSENHHYYMTVKFIFPSGDFACPETVV